AVLVPDRCPFGMLLVELTAFIGLLTLAREIPITRLNALHFEQHQELSGALTPIALEEIGFPTLVLRPGCQLLAQTLLELFWRQTGGYTDFVTPQTLLTRE